jgi:hypothetical protein
MLVLYNGTKDPDYSGRLCDRVRVLLEDPSRLGQHSASVAIAETNFEYDVLTVKIRRILGELLPGWTEGSLPGKPGLPAAAENKSGSR